MKRLLLVCLLIVSLISIMLLTGCGNSGNEITLSLSFGERTGTYNGEVNADGLPDGQGTFTSVNDSGDSWTYTGTFVNGHFEGEGKIEWGNGYKEIGVYHDDMIQPEPAENVSKMYNNPDEYEGHYFELTGQVFNVIGVSDGQLQFQINEDIENADHNTIVVCTDDVSVSTDEYVKLTGTVQGTEEYQNMVGGTVEAVIFVADSVEIIDYKDAAAPTLKEVSVNKTAEQYGYIASLKDIWENDFLPTSKKMKSIVDDPMCTDVSWDDIEPILYECISRVQVKEINGKAADGGLDYEHNPNGLYVIAIGGDKLSRGLTLYGISISYYIRTSKMYDNVIRCLYENDIKTFINSQKDYIIGMLCSNY